MDLKSLLNEDKEESHNNVSTSTAAKRPPPLSTSRSHYTPNAPTPTPSHYESPQPYAHPAVAHSPGSFAPPSAHSYTSTPHSTLPPPTYQSPFQRTAPLPSPGPRSGSLSNSLLPGQRPLSHHSLHRSSTSPFDQPPIFHESPPLSRVVPPSSAYHYQQLQPHTPLGPPATLRRDSTHSTHTFYDSPGTAYQRHRSSSGASHISPALPTGLPPSLPKSSTLPKENLARLESHQTHDNQRDRFTSLSVSPKTIVHSLPRQTSQDYSVQDVSTPVTYSQSHIPQHNISEKLSALNQTVDAVDKSDGPRLSIEAPTHAIPDGHPDFSKVGHSHGMKRNADSFLSPEITSNAKKPRMAKEVPIWAQPKKSLRPLFGRAGPKSNAQTPRSRTPLRPSPSAQPSQLQVASGVAGNAVAEQDFDYSYTNVIPTDDITKKIADFIFALVVTPDPTCSLPFEIEAKVGRITDKTNNSERLWIPIQSEAILNESGLGRDITFQSNMTEMFHQAMNNHLNDTVVESKNPPTTEQARKRRCPMEYKHSREIDTFYELPPDGIDSLPSEIRSYMNTYAAPRFKNRHHRVRVTHVQGTGEVKAKVIKLRSNDVNVLCPNANYDWRVSINLEVPWEGSIDTLEDYAARSGPREPNRKKDRLSYKHQFCQIDLTQVYQGDKDKTHELEVELDVDVMRREAAQVMQGQKSKYLDYVKVFLDNVRTLARKQ